MFTKAYNDTPRGKDSWNTDASWYQNSAATWYDIASDDIGYSDVADLIDEWQQSKTNSARRAATARYIMGIRESDYDHG